MPILDLRFTHIGPFDDIAFEFDRHVNVFVGPNNSGKSTVLMVLGEIAAYPFRIPRKLLKKVPAEFTLHVASDHSESEEFRGPIPLVPTVFFEEKQQQLYLTILKEIGYTCFIPALRQSTDFRSRGPIVRKKEIPEGMVPPRIPMLLPENLARREALFQTDASLIRDEAIIESIIELDYRAYRRNEPAIRKIVDKVATIASEITEGFPIQFLRVAEDEGGLFPQFRTPDGDVPLNVLSQGTQSILQWLAFLLFGYAKYYDYASDLEKQPGIVIIDEIDAHLHPSWQRRIIPALRHHFPNLQLFCSTHSPLMLAGLKAGQVQLLKRGDHGKITVSRNETDIVGWSADEILTGFLDVPNPTDLDTAKDIERLQKLRRKSRLTAAEAAELERLRHTVNQELLGGPIATQIEQLTALLEQSKTVSTRQLNVGTPNTPRKTKRRGKTSSPVPPRKPSK